MARPLFNAGMFGVPTGLDMTGLKTPEMTPTIAAAASPPRRRGLSGMLGGVVNLANGVVDPNRQPNFLDFLLGGQNRVDAMRQAPYEQDALQFQRDQHARQRQAWAEGDATQRRLREWAATQGPEAQVDPASAYEAWRTANAPPTRYQREEIQLGRDRLTEDRRYHDLTAANGGPNGFGRAPPGYAWNPDGTQRIIRGGPADQRFTQQQQRAARTALDALSNGNLVLDSLATARRQASGWTTGFVGSLLQGVPGSTAHDMQQTLATIRANIGFDKLAQMRANSPTGGALGNVSDRETALLQSVLGSLEQSQSQAQFLQNLDNLERTYRASMQRIREAYEQDFGGAQQQAAPAQGGGNQADPLGIR